MNFCANCGADRIAGAYCANCGTHTTQRQPAGPSSTGGPYAGPVQAAPGGQSKGVAGVIIAGVTAAAVVVAAGFVAFAVMSSAGENKNSATSGSIPAANNATTTDTTTDVIAGAGQRQPAKKSQKVSASAGTSAGPGNVLVLPAGLFCRDLYARGFSYVAAIDYWRNNGQPNQMDEDRNGIPCQTVYTPADVSAYWGDQAVSLPQQVITSATNLPEGLFCRDLYAAGYSYSEAVDYWFYTDLPDQMDADLNGIPCETVYPTYTVSDYWH